MSRRKLRQAEPGQDSSRLIQAFDRRRVRDRYGATEQKASVSFRCGICRIARLTAFAALLIYCSLETAKAEQADFGVYTRAAEFCRGHVKRHMTLDLDRRVLCFDGAISEQLDISFADGLQEGGLFVVRSMGGSAFSAMALADRLRDRHAIVVVYDYCLSACASFLLLASTRAFVLRNTLVAWHLTPDPSLCPSLVASKDDGPKRLEKSPCSSAPAWIRDGYDYFRYMKSVFYAGRTIDPLFDNPPESVIIRKRLRSIFEGTGNFPDILWTWNPRHYATALRTKIVYEAYPESQAEVDVMAAKLQLYRVIHDP